MLNEIMDFYEIDGYMATAQKHCDDNHVPYDVFRWRKKQGRAGKELFITPQRVVYYAGEFNTLEMLAEKTGIPEDIIYGRYRNGLRGAQLVQEHKTMSDEGRMERQKIQCREHLRALIRAHPDKAVEAIKRKVNGIIDDPIDPAVAMINAQRFEDQARGYLVESTGHTWDAMQ